MSADAGVFASIKQYGIPLGMDFLCAVHSKHSGSVRTLLDDLMCCDFRSFRRQLATWATMIWQTQRQKRWQRCASTQLRPIAASARSAAVCVACRNSSSTLSASI